MAAEDPSDFADLMKLAKQHRQQKRGKGSPRGERRDEREDKGDIFTGLIEIYMRRQRRKIEKTGNVTGLFKFMDDLFLWLFEDMPDVAQYGVHYLALSGKEDMQDWKWLGPIRFPLAAFISIYMEHLEAQLDKIPAGERNRDNITAALRRAKEATLIVGSKGWQATKSLYHHVTGKTDADVAQEIAMATPHDPAAPVAAPTAAAAAPIPTPAPAPAPEPIKVVLTAGQDRYRKILRGVNELRLNEVMDNVPPNPHLFHEVMPYWRQCPQTCANMPEATEDQLNAFREQQANLIMMRRLVIRGEATADQVTWYDRTRAEMSRWYAQMGVADVIQDLIDESRIGKNGKGMVDPAARARLWIMNAIDDSRFFRDDFRRDAKNFMQGHQIEGNDSAFGSFLKRVPTYLWRATVAFLILLILANIAFVWQTGVVWFGEKNTLMPRLWLGSLSLMLGTLVVVGSILTGIGNFLRRGAFVTGSFFDFFIDRHKDDDEDEEPEDGTEETDEEEEHYKPPKSTGVRGAFTQLTRAGAIVAALSMPFAALRHPEAITHLQAYVLAFALVFVVIVEWYTKNHTMFTLKQQNFVAWLTLRGLTIMALLLLAGLPFAFAFLPKDGTDPLAGLRTKFTEWTQLEDTPEERLEEDAHLLLLMHPLRCKRDSLDQKWTGDQVDTCPVLVNKGEIDLLGNPKQEGEITDADRKFWVNIAITAIFILVVGGAIGNVIRAWRSGGDGGGKKKKEKHG